MVGLASTTTGQSVDNSASALQLRPTAGSEHRATAASQASRTAAVTRQGNPGPRRPNPL